MEVGMAVYPWPGDAQCRKKGTCAVVTSLYQFGTAGEVMQGHIEPTGSGQIEDWVILP